MKIITLEGFDCSGKTTTSLFLRDFLRQKQFKVEIFNEPFGLPSHKSLRNAFVSSEPVFISPISEAILFTLSRIETISFIKKNCSDYDFIIFDRYVDSTIAYQCGGMGCSEDQLEKIYASAFPDYNKWKPDLTFLLNIDLDTFMSRIKLRGESKIHWEKLGPDFTKRVLKKFTDIAKENKDRVVVIDNESGVDLEQCFEKIKFAVSKRFGIS